MGTRPRVSHVVPGGSVVGQYVAQKPFTLLETEIVSTKRRSLRLHGTGRIAVR